MEAEQYFKCPVCGKRVLKSEGVMLMWSMICQDCYKTAISYKKQKEESK